MYKMQRLEVSVALRPIYGSLGVKRLNKIDLQEIYVSNLVRLLGTGKVVMEIELS